jgi:hypothetical protein
MLITAIALFGVAGLLVLLMPVLFVLIEVVQARERNATNQETEWHKNPPEVFLATANHAANERLL